MDLALAGHIAMAISEAQIHGCRGDLAIEKYVLRAGLIAYTGLRLCNYTNTTESSNE
ncbi:hypothetical protein ACODYM_29090 [Burkholderia gladioli]|uniref:hypothetical protein n=1 Tax=Burkholderia gladioli TaxID=28095 RepID=UPI003B50713D